MKTAEIVFAGEIGTDSIDDEDAGLSVEEVKKIWIRDPPPWITPFDEVIAMLLATPDFIEHYRAANGVDCTFDLQTAIDCILGRSAAPQQQWVEFLIFVCDDVWWPTVLQEIEAVDLVEIVLSGVAVGLLA